MLKNIQEYAQNFVYFCVTPIDAYQYVTKPTIRYLQVYTLATQPFSLSFTSRTETIQKNFLINKSNLIYLIS